MKKIKLLTSLVGLTGLSMGLVPMISGCSCSKSNVELDESVTKQKISIKSENIVKGQESTIEFNLPTGKTISKITLKIGDNEVTEANVTVKGNKVTIPASKMTAGKVIVKKITLASEAQSVDFLTCDWSEINTWCTKFENKEIDVAAFCAHFWNSTTPITSMDDFVGLERTIQINNKDHVIRVIGTQHDTIVESGKVTGKTAALTFELKTLLSDSEGKVMASQWDKGDETTVRNYDYTNSTLRKNLTGEGEGTVQWYKSDWKTESEETRTALEMLPSDLQSVIKTVNKKVATYDGTEPWSKTHYEVNAVGYNDKLFPLTYTEMTETPHDTILKEGTTYKYWKDHTKTVDTDKTDSSKTEEWKPYLLTSPDSYNNWVVANVSHWSGASGYNGAHQKRGVSFAFCI